MMKGLRDWHGVYSIVEGDDGWEGTERFWVILKYYFFMIEYLYLILVMLYLFDSLFIEFLFLLFGNNFFYVYELVNF